MRSRFSSRRNYLRVGRISRELRKNSIEYLLQDGHTEKFCLIFKHRWLYGMFLHIMPKNDQDARKLEFRKRLYGNFQYDE